MEDYRKIVIEMVRRRPLLWDPNHENYKNKDLKAIAWGDIESKIQFPPGKLVFKECFFFFFYECV